MPCCAWAATAALKLRAASAAACCSTDAMPVAAVAVVAAAAAVAAKDGVVAPSSFVAEVGVATVDPEAEEPEEEAAFDCVAWLELPA